MYSTSNLYTAGAYCEHGKQKVLTMFTLLFLCFALIFLISVTICVYKV